MQVLQAPAVIPKTIDLFQYARIRDCGRCKVSPESTVKAVLGTSHLASDAAGSLIHAINTFGLLPTRIYPQLPAT